MNLRIGFVANNQNDCLSCDSCIGFGISVQGCDGDVKARHVATWLFAINLATQAQQGLDTYLYSK